MKSLYSVLALLLIAADAMAQTALPTPPPPPTTKLEAFTGNTGTVVIKAYEDIGRISATNDIEITAMTFKDPNSKEQTSGLTIEVTETSSRSYQASSTAFIDYDELSGLLDGIKYVSKANKDVTSLPFYEVSYQTRGKLRITVFNSGNGRTSVAIAAGSYGAKTAYVTLSQLKELEDLVGSGKQLLDGLK